MGLYNGMDETIPSTYDGLDELRQMLADYASMAAKEKAWMGSVVPP